MRPGRLKIFLGMCPGVGKTYAMLEEAIRLQSEGRNVCIGVVETHGRTRTLELSKRIKSLPLVKTLYRGVGLNSLNLDALLELRPDLVLIDELATTNAPGSRHEKRYQDIQEVIRHGIDVYTTVNIQHVASRSDLVTSITGVTIRETVPDQFFESAQEIRLVDVSIEDLLIRLESGQIYQKESAHQATHSFFKSETLFALRELALRFTAEIVDLQLQKSKKYSPPTESWNTNERLLVSLGPSPTSEFVIRAARRLAFSLNAPWVAAYVDTGDTLSLGAQNQLKKNINSAKDLGAEVVQVQADSVHQGLKRIIRENQVTQVVVGNSPHFWKKSIVQEMLSDPDFVDIHVVRSPRSLSFAKKRLEIGKIFKKIGPFKFQQEWWAPVAIVALISLLGGVLESSLGYQSIGFFYLMGILILFSAKHLSSIFFSALLSTLAWDVFFVPPKFQFSIEKTEDALMIFAFFLSSLALGLLVHSLRKKESALRQRESRARYLYRVAKNFNDALALEDFSKNLIGLIQELIGVEARFIAPQDIPLVSDTVQRTLLEWSNRNKTPSGFGTETLSTYPVTCYPLLGNQDIVAFILIFHNQQSKKIYEIDIERLELVQLTLEQAAFFLDRIRLQKLSNDSEIYKRSEELQQNILNSVSHELRTPLATLYGLIDLLPQNTDQRIKTILSKTLSRLKITVDQLLESSRWSSCKGFNVHIESIEFYESVKAFLADPDFELNEIPVEVIRPESSVIGYANPGLLNQIITNLIRNSFQADPSSQVKISFSEGLDHVVLKVQDNGPGIPPEFHDRIFDPFFRLPQSRPGGIGLGLSLVKSFMSAQGGSVACSSGDQGRGTLFELRFPKNQGAHS